MSAAFGPGLSAYELVVASSPWGHFTHIACQSAEHMQRFVDLGVDAAEGQRSGQREVRLAVAATSGSSKRHC